MDTTSENFLVWFMYSLQQEVFIGHSELCQPMLPVLQFSRSKDNDKSAKIVHFYHVFILLKYKPHTADYKIISWEK